MPDTLAAAWGNLGRWTLIRAKDLQTMVSREGKEYLYDMSQYLIVVVFVLVYILSLLPLMMYRY